MLGCAARRAAAVPTHHRFIAARPPRRKLAIATPRDARLCRGPSRGRAHPPVRAAAVPTHPSIAAPALDRPHTPTTAAQESFSRTAVALNAVLSRRLTAAPRHRRRGASRRSPHRRHRVPATARCLAALPAVPRPCPPIPLSRRARRDVSLRGAFAATPPRSLPQRPTSHDVAATLATGDLEYQEHQEYQITLCFFVKNGDPPAR